MFLPALGFVAFSLVVFAGAWACSSSLRLAAREFAGWWLNMAVLFVPAMLIGALWAWLEFKGLL